MNKSQQKMLAELFRQPPNGNIEWAEIERFLVAIGCRKIERGGSGVAFEMDGKRAFFHRPHPYKQALRYRVMDVRHFLIQLGITP